MTEANRRRGVFDRWDQIQFSSEFNSAMKYMAEHNPIAYFVFIDRHDLVREMLLRGELNGKHQALWHLLEKRRHAEKFDQQIQLNNQIAQESLIKQQQKQLEDDREFKLKTERALTNIDLYLHYIQLQQEIDNDFHKKQIQILDNSYKGRADRIKSAIEIAKADPSISAEDREELKELETYYAQEYEKIQQIPIVKADGTPDHDGLKRRAEALNELDAGVGGRFADVIGRMAAKSPNNEGLNKIRRDEAEAVRVTKADLKQNEAVYKERSEEIRPNVEQTRQVAKAELESAMSNLVGCLDEFDLEAIPMAERDAFQNSLSKLNQYKNALDKTDDAAQIKDLTNKFTEELILVKERVKPSMLKFETFQKLENEASVLEKLRDRINMDPAVLKTPSASVSDELPSDAQAKQAPPPPPAQNEAAAKEEPASEKPQQAQAAANVTSSFRGHMFHSRAQHNGQAKSEVQNAQNANGGKTVEFDGEAQENFKEFNSALSQVLGDIRDEGGMSPEEVEQAAQLETLCEQIASTIEGQVDASKVEEAYDLFNKLKGNHSELVVLSDKFDSVTDALNNSPRLAR